MTERHPAPAAPDRLGRPWALRDYAFLGDGERGALVDPDGAVVWLCAPGWDDDAVFSRLIGGPGQFVLCPEDEWRVWGGSYEDGTLIRVHRWIVRNDVVECRDALARPADPGRAVLLRTVRAVRGDAHLRVRLAARPGFGAHRVREVRREDGYTAAAAGPLHLRISGLPRPGPDGEGTFSGRLHVPEGEEHHIVLELAPRPRSGRLDARELWEATERAWRRDVPGCEDLAAPRDSRTAHAVLHGMTSTYGGMAAAATTSLPERADTGRNYDYRYCWIRDQCYAGLAAAAHGRYPLLDSAVRFTTERLLEDGPGLRPAYTVRGEPVPADRRLGFPGYPGGDDHVGNDAGTQFQLDVFGEVLQLLSAAARLGRLGRDGRRALHIAASAVEAEWRKPDAGLWELEQRWWTHSRLSAVAGLREAARVLPRSRADRWRAVAADVLAETRRRCLHPAGHWQRAADDDGVDAALLMNIARGAVDPAADGAVRTRREIRRRLAEDGYLYRFRHGDSPLGREEGAFLLCGFMMALAAERGGAHEDALRWFERTRAACGPAGLFAEEYDVLQRQLRGNLPQAFVHALLLESSVRLSPAGRPDPGLPGGPGGSGGRDGPGGPSRSAGSARAVSDAVPEGSRRPR